MEKAAFDRFADNYYAEHAQNIRVSGESPEFFAEYKVNDALAAAVSKGMTPQRILDFGTGIGNSLPWLRRNFPAAELIAADVSQRCLDVAEARFPGIAQNLLIESAGIPMADAAVDLAFGACVFHHIEPLERPFWMAELLRVTRPGGMLVLFEHNPWNPLTVHLVRECPLDVNAHLVNARDLAIEARLAGWRGVDIRYRLFFPRALAFARGLEKLLTHVPFGGQYMIAAERP